MYCSKCGKEVPEDARFCRNCGASVGPAEEAPVGRQPSGQPVPPPSGAPLPASPLPPSTRHPAGPSGSGGPGAPRNGNRRTLWIGVAAAAVIVIAVAVAVPLALAGGDGDEEITSSTTITTSADSTTTTESVTTTSSASSSTSVSTSTTVPVGPPGDSAGEWVEMDIPEAPDPIMSVALSDDVLLIQTFSGSRNSLHAYTFSSGEWAAVPVDSPDFGGIDLDGLTAVWWEGDYDDALGSYVNQRVYLYDAAAGRKREVLESAVNIGYTQVAGTWVTWTEGRPWEVNPEEYWLVPIYGSLAASAAGAAGDPIPLAPSAVAAILGDSTWTYSLSEQFLAWEQHTPVDGLSTGTYVRDLATLPPEPRSIGTDAWRPSLSGDLLVYWRNGLRLLDLDSGHGLEIDPRGDFAVAAPTFAAYFRPVERPDGGPYEIVARGYSGAYEQVLAPQAAVPWLSFPIFASATRVAFVIDDVLHVFEWRGR